MRGSYRFGILLVAGWCGCLSTAEQSVDITAPQARITRRDRADSSALETRLQAAAEQTDGEQQQTVVRVFYGTDRAPLENGDPLADSDDYYSGVPGRLEYGFCHVSIPESDESGEMERPRIWRLEFVDEPDQGAVLSGIEPVNQNSFADELRSDVNESETGAAFVFVPGGTMEFPEAARRTAQIAHDLRFDGPPVLYSWLSQGSGVDYLADQKTLLFSTAHLVEFLQTVSRESGAKQLHVIAHGAGNQLVAEVLRDFAEISDSSARPHFNEVILAAPDMDTERFRRTAPRIASVAHRVTVYASSENRSLHASEAFHETDRQGQGHSDLDDVLDVPGIEVVDVAAINFDFSDAENSALVNELLSDIRQVFGGAATTQRGLQPHPSRHAVWRLPTATGLQFVSYAEPADEGDAEEVEGDTELEGSPDTPTTSLWGKVRSWWPW